MTLRRQTSSTYSIINQTVLPSLCVLWAHIPLTIRMQYTTATIFDITTGTAKKRNKMQRLFGVGSWFDLDRLSCHRCTRKSDSGQTHAYTHTHTHTRCQILGAANIPMKRFVSTMGQRHSLIVRYCLKGRDIGVNVYHIVVDKLTYVLNIWPVL